MKRSTLLWCGVLLLILWVSLGHGESNEVRILYVNDFHGFAEPYQPIGSKEPLGGAAYLAAKIDELRKERPSLLLAAGDMIQGNNWANLFEGESVVEWMNAMKFDAMVVGNHEFDFGQEVLKKTIAGVNFPILGANVAGVTGIKPYVLKEFGGVRIGILGVTTEDTAIYTHPRNVLGLQFLPVVDTLERYLPELKSTADFVIVLSHLGYPEDRAIAEKVKGIDIIVGGHSHTRVERPSVVNGTLVVQAWEHGKALGVLDLRIENQRINGFQGYLKEIRPKAGEADRDILALVEKYSRRIEAVLGEKIGVTEVDLDGEHVRTRETNLGNFVSDILKEVSGADATIINAGGIRASIKKGEVKVRDFYTALPFSNYIVAIRLTGRQIREALEHGVSAVEEEAGRFPQVSGILFKYSASEPRGSRVREVLVGGKPVDPDRAYVVATNDFLAAGGDGYTAFGEAMKASKDFSVVGGMLKGEKIVYNDTGRWIRDVVVDRFRRMGRVAPRVEGRIQEVR